MVVYITTMLITGNGIPEREPEKRLPALRIAAGAQIAHSQFEEAVTRNNHAFKAPVRGRKAMSMRRV